MNERQTIDRGWFYVIEPEDGVHAPADKRIRADDGRILTRRLHGHPGRVEVVDATGASLPWATLLRANAAVGTTLEQRGWQGREALVELLPAGTPATVDDAPDGRLRLRLDGVWVHDAASHHQVDALVASRITERPPRGTPPTSSLPERPAPRAMFFESLMNTDMPHNDNEISQGVLHMISPLAGTGTDVVLVNAKMPIVGDHRPVHGLHNLEAALASGPVHLVGITLLEGYWEGVGKLIATLRKLGCRAHIAVGGVMPSLAPDHVAAHLDEVSFICRGAGEYFVRRLAEVVGDTDVDTPFTDAQRHALLQMDGVISRDHAGKRLLSGNSARTVSVDSLDRVDLDLSHVQHRHIEGGIEINTSRGCIHKCSFCSILGRESYQARSAGSIFDLLGRYEDRFGELHGDFIPPNSYRVHISDDDFACDRDRAKAFFEDLLESPFRLASVQVAVGDLCRREGNRLLAEPDHELLDAIQPRCFHDHGRPIPKVDFYEDHKSRKWSSFLQIGVETYDDREIARLGKGYKRIHVRTIVAELAHRGLHMDGYFILSNADTTAEDLVNVFAEVARLKLRYPEHFHMRFPVVPRLVSYFTAASHRRHLRRGRGHVMKLRGHAQVPNHTEFDYPFVDCDMATDAIVSDTVESDFVTDEGFYTGNLDILRTMWGAWARDGHPEAPRIHRLMRALDDRPRRLTFEMLHQAWTGEELGWPDPRLDKQACLEHAERVLGPREDWFSRFKVWMRTVHARRLLTHRLDPEVVDLLVATDVPEVTIRVAVPTDAAALDALATYARSRCGRRDADKVVRIEVDGDSVRGPVPDGVDWVLHRGVHDTWEVPSLQGSARLCLRVSPADIDGLADALGRLDGVDAVHLLPLGTWSAGDAKRLGAALFAARNLLADVAVHGGDPWADDPAATVTVDVDGHIGRADGLRDGRLAASHRLARLDDHTSVDRHQLDLADPGVLRGVVPTERVLQGRKAFDQVVTSFLAWRTRTAAPPQAAHSVTGRG